MVKSVLDQEEDLDRLFQALADRNRRHMLERLSTGPASVTELAERLPVTLAAVVQHVQVLEGAGLVHSTKVGRVRRCELEPDRLRPVDAWIAERRTLLAAAFDRLGAVLVEPERSSRPPNRRRRNR
jgi:DNA-binding transcriptional ArsR family regulator